MEVITLPLESLTMHKRNAKLHPQEQIEQIKESIKLYGFNDPIGIWGKNNTIVEGHGRYMAAKEMGIGEVPCIRLDHLSDKQRREYMLVHNQTTMSSGWDFDLLAQELDGLDFEGFDFGFDFDFGDEKDKEIIEDEPPEVDEENEPICKLGDIWQLGNHRLMCGDSTDREQVEMLMNGEKADMVFTDPPYGVNVKGGTGKDKNGKILGDLTQTAIPFSFEIAVEYVTKPKAHFYWCGGESNLEMYSKLFNRYLNILPKHLIWVKNGFSMKQVGYHNQYEIIYFGYKVGSGGLWYGGRTEDEASDVWQINREKTHNYLHPTQKPIELVARAVKNSCPKNGIVLDMFGGSGSTLIACEQLEKQCCIMELDPRYADTIISRWEQFTGKKAVKVNG